MILNVKKTTDLSLVNCDIVLGTKYGLRQDVFSKAEIVEIIKSFPNKVYIAFDKIFHETELDKMEEYLSDLVNLVEGIYFADFAVYNYLKKLNLENKLIYNASTLMTNYLDVLDVLSLGIKRVVLSKEITLLEVKEIIEKTNDVEVIVHGKINMFYSKRKLLSLYYDYQGLEKDFNDISLVEELRDEELRIIEDENGSHIFSADYLNSYQEIKELNCHHRIDGFLMSDEEIYQELKIYQSILSGLETEINLEGKNSGFYYKKTHYNKNK